MAGSFQSRPLGDFWQSARSLVKSGVVNTMSVSSGSNCSGGRNGRAGREGEREESG